MVLPSLPVLYKGEKEASERTMRIFLGAMAVGGLQLVLKEVRDNYSVSSRLLVEVYDRVVYVREL